MCEVQVIQSGKRLDGRMDGNFSSSRGQRAESETSVGYHVAFFMSVGVLKTDIFACASSMIVNCETVSPPTMARVG